MINIAKNCIVSPRAEWQNGWILSQIPALPLSGFLSSSQVLPSFAEVLSEAVALGPLLPSFLPLPQLSAPTLGTQLILTLPGTSPHSAAITMASSFTGVGPVTAVLSLSLLSSLYDLYVNGPSFFQLYCLILRLLKGLTGNQFLKCISIQLLALSLHSVSTTLSSSIVFG